MTEAARHAALPESREERRALRLLPLGGDDAEAVFSLYRKVEALVPHGHLAERLERDFEAILSDNAASASAGAWAGDRLVAYSLCSLETRRVYQDAPLVRMVQDSGEPLWTGKGTVVDPEFEGQLLLSRLLRLRGELIHARSVPHTAGIIATSNLPSLAGTLRAGAWIVGLEHDSYCQNFVCYAGRLQPRFALGERVELPADDLAALGPRLLDGWVGVGLTKDTASSARRLTFARLSSAGDA